MRTEYRVEEWPIERLRPNPRNPRRITEQAVRKLADAIKRYGYRVAIVAQSDGLILAGHTRQLALQHLGHTHVHVHVVDNLTPEEAALFALADNRLAEETTWDIGRLVDEVARLGSSPDGRDALESIWSEAEVAALEGDLAAMRAADPSDDDDSNGEPGLGDQPADKPVPLVFTVSSDRTADYRQRIDEHISSLEASPNVEPSPDDTDGKIVDLRDLPEGAFVLLRTADPSRHLDRNEREGGLGWLLPETY